MTPNPKDNAAIERELRAEIKLYYDLHLPDERPAPLLVALHGYGASKGRMMREARQIAPPAEASTRISPISFDIFSCIACACFIIC